MDSFKHKVFWLLGVSLILMILYLAREALVVLFIAFIFASAVLPLVEKLDKKLPRLLAVFIPFAFLFIITIVVVLPTLTLGFQQLQLFAQDIPTYLEQSRLWIGQWAAFTRHYPILTGFMPEKLMNQASLQNPVIFSGFTVLTLGITKVVINILSAGVISFLLLLEREQIQKYFLRFRPVREHERLNAMVESMIRSTGGFVSGQLLFMSAVGGMIGLSLHLLGLPFSILLGILTGILTVIPILGPNIAMIPALAIALFMPGGVVIALWVLAVYIIVQVIANNIIGPFIMGRAVGLPALAIILAILAGGIMFGMVGIVLAIPVVTCLNIILEEWFMDPDHRLNRLLQEQDGPGDEGLKKIL